MKALDMRRWELADWELPEDYSEALFFTLTLKEDDTRYKTVKLPKWVQEIARAAHHKGRVEVITAVKESMKK